MDEGSITCAGHEGVSAGFVEHVEGVGTGAGEEGACCEVEKGEARSGKGGRSGGEEKIVGGSGSGGKYVGDRIEGVGGGGREEDEEGETRFGKGEVGSQAAAEEG